MSTAPTDALELLREIYADLVQGAIPNADDPWWQKASAALAGTPTHAQAGATLVHLDHIACIDGGELRYITGRKAPAYDCELYAMPNGGSAPQLYAAPTTQPSHKQEESKPHGWLYDWTHSSATGKPDTTYTGFTKDEAHARKHDNCTAIYTSPQPAPQQEAQEPSPTAGMNIAQRILHVGGRNPPGSTYVEFGSIQAVEALVKHVLRDLQPSPAAQGDAPESEYRRGYRHGYEQRDAEVRGALV